MILGCEKFTRKTNQLKAPRKADFKGQLQIYVLESDSHSLTQKDSQAARTQGLAQPFRVGAVCFPGSVSCQWDSLVGRRKVNGGLPIPTAASWFSPRKLKGHRVAPGSWLLPKKMRKFPQQLPGSLNVISRVSAERLRDR